MEQIIPSYKQQILAMKPSILGAKGMAEKPEWRLLYKVRIFYSCRREREKGYQYLTCRVRLPQRLNYCMWKATKYSIGESLKVRNAADAIALRHRCLSPLEFGSIEFPSTRKGTSSAIQMQPGLRMMDRQDWDGRLRPLLIKSRFTRQPPVTSIQL
ncbi:unnamed protein product [Arabis nemorensis]|uniref:Uncharacterized protein n=1 Tax=Arabis nemorensis TaxID=586526 RepID=A0A565CII3_9BRAS|nr:unnamed protein product [Arabis nemorensis]